MRIVNAILVICILATPALAVENQDNWMSLVYDPYSTVYDFNCNWAQFDSYTTVTLWLIRPVNPDFEGVERDVENVSYFDVKIDMTEGLNPGDWMLSAPGTLVDDGNGSLRGAFDEPVPVIDQRVALATCEVYIGDLSFAIPDTIWARCTYNQNAWTSLSPVAAGAMPGEICYMDADDLDDGRVKPRTFEDTDLMFAIVLNIVGQEKQSWDAVKALFR